MKKSYKIFTLVLVSSDHYLADTTSFLFILIHTQSKSKNDVYIGEGSWFKGLMMS